MDELKWLREMTIITGSNNPDMNLAAHKQTLLIAYIQQLRAALEEAQEELVGAWGVETAAASNVWIARQRILERQEPAEVE